MMFDLCCTGVFNTSPRSTIRHFSWMLMKARMCTNLSMHNNLPTQKGTHNSHFKPWK